MKKLMMMAAVAACAIQAQAADTYTATINFGEAYSGYSVWTVNCWNKGTHTEPEYDYSAPFTGIKSGKNFGTELETAASTEDYATQLDLLNNYAKAKDFSTVNNGISGVGSVTVGDNGTATITSGIGNEMYSWLFVLVSGLDASGNATYGTEYAVVRAHESSSMYTKEGSTYTYKTGDYTLSGDKASGGNIEFSTVGVVAAPEPTSGILLLLGMAGLCLRRKQRG